MRHADDDQYFGLTDLARYSGLSDATLRRHLNDPERPIPYARIGGRILVKRSAFDAWVADAAVLARPAALKVREAYARRAQDGAVKTWARILKAAK